VHRAYGIAAENELLVLAESRQEDDRRVACAFARLDDLCGLETTEARQLNVEQDQRVFIQQQLAQCIDSTLCTDERLSKRLQDDLECQKILWLVIDHEEPRRRVALVHSVPRPAVTSVLSSWASASSGATV